jgi:hypothetical protein
LEDSFEGLGADELAIAVWDRRAQPAMERGTAHAVPATVALGSRLCWSWSAAEFNALPLHTRLRPLRLAL